MSEISAANESVLVGGLVDTAIRAARSEEREAEDNLDDFMKSIMLFKQALYRHMLDKQNTQSLAVNQEYERLLARIMKDVLDGTCDAGAYALPAKCAEYATDICRLYNDSTAHQYWIRQLMKVSPYAYNMRATARPPAFTD